MPGLAIVTGGSRGIGAATCLCLARDGFDICVSYLANRDRAEAVVESCRSLGVRAEAVAADIADPEAVRQMFAQCDTVFGLPSVLVNNAGIIGQTSRMADLSDEALDVTFRTNVFGPIYCIREAIPRMSVTSGGSGGAIVNISSIAATLGSPGEYVHYAASKAAVDAMTIGLSKELGPEGIRVNAVQAGTTDTEIHTLSGNPDRPAKVAASAPLGRVARPEDIAEAAAWLASPAASYTTGAILRIGGGL